MYHASTILADDRVEGGMGGSLTQFTDLRHRLPQQTAACEPHEGMAKAPSGFATNNLPLYSQM